MSGPQCCSNPPTLNPASGAGHVEKLGVLDTYVSGLPDSKLAVFLISDVHGYEAPNLRKLADKIAAAGFYVVVPDFFYGDPYSAKAGKPIRTWLEGHGTDKGVEDAKPVIEALKSKGISAIGAVGFCWGAKVVQLAKREVIQAAVLCHPSFVTVDDIKGQSQYSVINGEINKLLKEMLKKVEVPIAVLGAEIDHLSPPSLLKQFEEVITANNEVDGYVKIFPKVEHGWTVRYDVGDEAAVKPAEEAHQNMLEWFANVLFVKI
ncbi:hypothetical protein LWI29_003946 [Acer saccharum]|uniref:Dienelactone hydrolase domain-containing protein n=1 Tax=Acer saccharum TaxID=4024 RepID=A0AA39W8U3_ACESA|nr:hypothetical protein LWI29_003946 [Acer saccharum]